MSIVFLDFFKFFSLKIIFNVNSKTKPHKNIYTIILLLLTFYIFAVYYRAKYGGLNNEKQWIKFILVPIRS